MLHSLGKESLQLWKHHAVPISRNPSTCSYALASCGCVCKDWKASTEPFWEPQRLLEFGSSGHQCVSGSSSTRSSHRLMFAQYAVRLDRHLQTTSLVCLIHVCTRCCLSTIVCSSSPKFLDRLHEYTIASSFNVPGRACTICCYHLISEHAQNRSAVGDCKIAVSTQPS